MRRIVGLVAVIALIVGLPALSQARGADRRVVTTYEPVVVDPSFPAGSVSSSNVVSFKTRSSERFVRITIKDATSPVVPARVEQDLDDDGEPDRSTEICGSTDAPIAIDGGVPVTVHLVHGSCGPVESGRLGGWTTGEVTAVFSR